METTKHTQGPMLGCGCIALGAVSGITPCPLHAAAPQLAEALADMIYVARAAMILSGTDAEFAEIRVSKARSALAGAKVQP